MTVRIVPMSETESAAIAPSTDGGLGCLRTDRGNLPLESVDAQVTITGLVARTVLTQGFRNSYPSPLEATYVFPLPDRAAVTAMTLTADDRVIVAELGERGEAREQYDRAIAEGKRAAIAEQERADVFTMRVGNILPGERVTVALTVVGPLAFEDGEATFRLPLVVAPRYIPGSPVDGESVGAGYAVDTDAVPDASRITPPVLMTGFPNPIRLSIGVDLEPAGLPLGDVRSSLHAVIREGNHLNIQPGERVNRDFILRLAYGEPDAAAHTLTLTPDAEGVEGTFRLTVLPPTTAAPPRPRDVVLLLDRSGSMSGWKMVAARRAAARIVDTLAPADRFAVLTFDHAVDHPEELGAGLVEASDRNRFRAVRHLAGVDARGGTELLAPLTQAIERLPATDGRDRVLVLVTDGQVGNEDQILAATAPALGGIRVHTVGIDQAVNAGFLGRLAAAGGGRCELVESEDRLDDAMERIHRRIAAPVVAGLTATFDGLDVIDGSMTPARLPSLFPGVPLVVAGRYSARAGGTARVAGRTRDGADWSATVPATEVADPALTTTWARAHLGDLEDRFAAGTDVERELTATSLRFGVLCRFTAWLAVDTRTVTEGGQPRRIVQPVEQPAGWESMDPMTPMPVMARMALAAPSAAPPPAPMMSMPAPKGYPTGAGGRVSRRLRAEASSLRRLMSPSPERAADAGRPKLEEGGSNQLRGPLRVELDRLRGAAGLPELDRRELLVDLGSRLDALARHLVGLGLRVDVLNRLRDLSARLAEDAVLALDPAGFADLWRHTEAELADLAR